MVEKANIPREKLNPDRGKRRIADWTPAEAYTSFRFEHRHLEYLLLALNVPNEIMIAPKKGRMRGETMLLMTLYHFAWPSRLMDMEQVFQVPYTTISEILTKFIGSLYETYSPWLHNNYRWYSRRALYYRTCIMARHEANGYHEINEDLYNVIGFLDGTRLHISRTVDQPVGNEDVTWSGKIKAHCMNVLDITFPDAMRCISLCYPGSMHDANIFSIDQMRVGVNANFGADGIHGFNALLYADSAFAFEQHVTPAHKRQHGQEQLDDDLQHENTMMAQCRAAVEWTFGNQASIQKYNAITALQHMKERDLGVRYTVAVFLYNCHTCLYGSQVSAYFGCFPPELRDYLNCRDRLPSLYEYTI